MRAFILSLLTVSLLFAGIILAGGGAPAYVPNPATQVSGAAVGGDLSGTIGAANVISANTVALTAGAMTVTNNAGVREVTTRFDWTNAMVVALGASTTGDITVCTLPAKTVVKRCVVVIKTSAATVATLTVAVGRTGASYIDYVVVSDAAAAANTVYGATKATVGTNLYDGVTLTTDMPSYTGTTAIKAHYISTGGNLSTCTASTGTVYLTTELLQ